MRTAPEPLGPGTPWDKLPRNERSRLLPDLNRVLLAHADVREAFPRICRRLHRVLAHQHAELVLYEPDSTQLRLYAQHSPAGGALPENLTLPLDKTPYGEAYRSRRPVVVDDLRSPQFACPATQELLKYGRRSGCWVPLQTANSVLGTLAISAGHPGAYRPDDGYLLNEIAGQISLALANQLGLQQLSQLQQRLDDQIHDWNRSFRDTAATAACGVVQWSPGGVVSDANETFLRMVGRTRDDIRRGLNCADLTPTGEYRGLRLHAEQEFRDHGSFEPYQQEYCRPDGTRVPVLVSTGLLNQIRPPWLALVVELGEKHIVPELITDPIPNLIKDPIEDMGRLPSPSFPNWVKNSELIAAKSPVMLKVLRDIEQVAPTATAILLLGETGTGKEVLAHAIRDRSPRHNMAFIKVNCSAIPAGLLESELFGHEKGAFTGAHARKVGRLELAHRGTLFLDEVGDIPLELQPKLLRVLQEHEFERVGGTQTIKVDIRLIASTNRNLPEMVEAGEFRRDLFYRLSVFPVSVPSLRERPESIAILANSFSEKFSRRMHRPLLAIPAPTMAALQRWQWPGNIRELENLIERCVILSPGPELRLSPEELHSPPLSVMAVGQTLLDMERNHITRILHSTNGVVGGKHGAAHILGMKRTTLQHKMRQLNIHRH